MLTGFHETIRSFDFVMNSENGELVSHVIIRFTDPRSDCQCADTNLNIHPVIA
jgi:hypothetical protein